MDPVYVNYAETGIFLGWTFRNPKILVSSALQVVRHLAAPFQPKTLPIPDFLTNAFNDRKFEVISAHFNILATIRKALADPADERVACSQCKLALISEFDTQMAPSTLSDDAQSHPLWKLATPL